MAHATNKLQSWSAWQPNAVLTDFPALQKLKLL